MAPDLLKLMRRPGRSADAAMIAPAHGSRLREGLALAPEAAQFEPAQRGCVNELSSRSRSLSKCVQYALAPSVVVGCVPASPKAASVRPVRQHPSASSALAPRFVPRFDGAVEARVRLMRSLPQ